MKASKKCCICLRQGSSCVEKTDEHGIHYKTKLKSLVPEIDWNSNHYMCETCLQDLNVGYVFKQLCLNTLLMLNVESEGFYHSYKESYFQRHSDYDAFNSDSEEDKNIILESRTPTDFENEQCSTNVKNINQIFNEKTRPERKILSPIDPIQNTNIKLESNRCVGKSATTYNCKSCKQTFQRKYDLKKHEKTHNHFCNICQKSYKRKLLLQQHVTITHTDKKTWKYQCCYCNDVFPTKVFLNKHSKKQHKTTEILICFHCNKNFADKNILLDHIIAVHQISERSLKSDVKHSQKIDELQNVQHGVCNTGTIVNRLTKRSDQTLSIEISSKTEVPKKRLCRTFSCETCSEVFHSSVKLVHHCINTHDVDAKSVRPFACDLCEKRFSTSAILTEHRRYHLKNRQNICSFCGKGFITKNDLLCHEFIHLNERSFKCEVCFKGFNTKKNLRTHKLVKHADPMTWKHCCTICNKRFAILSNYKVHVRRHMGDKQFCCHLCDKRFVNKDELRQHTESHSNIREFKCQYCDKEYKKKRAYEIHLKKNHGIGNAKIPKREKKHICHICAKSYFDNSKLNKHLLSHSGIKPFICYICDKKFTDNYYMKRHMKNCHEHIICTVTSDVYA